MKTADSFVGNPDARCVERAGNHVAGALLKRICYWHPRMSRMRAGKLWIAKQRKEWMVEARLSLKQYNTSLATLKKKNLVETRQMIFGEKNITHVRLTPRGEAFFKDVEAAFETELQKLEGTAQDGEVDSLQAGPEGTLYNKEGGTSIEIQQVISDEMTSHACASAPACEEIFSGKGDDLPTVKELLMNPSPKKSSSPQSPPSPAAVARVAWRNALIERGKAWQPELKAKEQGQLSRIAKLAPPGKAGAMIAHVVARWPAFCAEAEAAAGLKITPEEPSIGFLLTHVGLAANFFLKAEAKAKPKESAAPKVGKQGPVQLIAQDAPHPKKPKQVSLEEFQSLTEDQE